MESSNTLYACSARARREGTAEQTKHYTGVHTEATARLTSGRVVAEHCEAREDQAGVPYDFEGIESIPPEVHGPAPFD